MRVAIVHPWFPQYRKAFFDELLEMGSQRGIEIDVFHGAPPPEWSERGDSILEEYAFPMRTKFFGFGGKNLVFKAPSTVWQRGSYDVLILEQAVRNLETYAFIFRRNHARLAFWGHGRTYTKPVGKTQERIKQFLTRRGSWFFAYTPGGARAVIDAGFPPKQVTVVQNSVDSTSLRNSIEKVSPRDTQEFADKYDLRKKTGLFIGGLDSSKRLDFLLDAADRAHAADKDFRLLVVGSGSSQSYVESAVVSRPWMSYLGPLFGQEKAVAMATADVLLMPGRVGLIAVDSFASGTPIVTTRWPWHAPEFEYLEAGENSVVTDDNVGAYADAIVDLLNDRTALDRLGRGAYKSADFYTVTRMAANFIRGIESMKRPSEDS